MLSTMLWPCLFCRAAGVHPTIDLHFCSQGSSDARAVWSKDRVVSHLPDVPTTQKQESAEEFSWNVICRLNLLIAWMGQSSAVWICITFQNCLAFGHPKMICAAVSSGAWQISQIVLSTIPLFQCRFTLDSILWQQPRVPCSAKQKLPRHLESREHSLVPGRAFQLRVHHSFSSSGIGGWSLPSVRLCSSMICTT